MFSGEKEELRSEYARLPRPTVRIFTDFDGTVAPMDVGEELFRHFCGEAHLRATLHAWEAGELSGVAMYRRLLAGARGLTREALRGFLDGMHIDAHFAAFAHWCETEGYPLVVLSDGFDAYIEPLLLRAGVRVALRCNEMRFDGDEVVLHFPHADERCRETANCKSNHVALLSRDEDRVVYIGDGRSDFAAAEYADLVFARGRLEPWCQERNITFRRFENFRDVLHVLSGMIATHRLRRRAHAGLLRKQLWSTG
ncbi:MAG TPA: MtnX-like HAD-IB family phosphatase [Bacteroidota bacterium]|nr:MtnX-like HAD-IB family phosphatase [Bacteroidota bacterium]